MTELHASLRTVQETLFHDLPYTTSQERAELKDTAQMILNEMHGFDWNPAPEKHCD